jgi:hypothetical protein
MVEIIEKTMTESEYKAMLNNPDYRYTAGDDKAFTKITIVNDTSGRVFTERVITPRLKEDGTKYESRGRSTSFGFNSYGSTAEESAAIWAKMNSGSPELAAEGYQQRADNLVKVYTSRGQSVERATNAANRLVYSSVKAVSDITGLDFKKASALQAHGVIADRRNLDAIIAASKVEGKLSSSSFLENMRKGNNQVLRKGLQLDPISREKDEYGNPVDPNGILDANGNVVDGRFAQNRPNLVKVSDNIYLNTQTGYSVAAASNGALLTQITGNTLNQMWSYGIGRDQFQKVRDYANNSNIKLVGLEQQTIDKVDWDSVQTTAGDTSFLVDYQASIESDQTLRSPEAAKTEDIVPGTTTVATPEPTYDETPTAIPVDTTTTEEPQQPTTPYTPTPTTPYTPTPTTVTGQPVGVGVTPTGVYPQAPVTGTMGTPLQTAGLSAVPQTVQVRPDYTGTTMQNLTSQSQKGFGGQRTFANQFGQQVTVTVDAQGNPLTYVPPGYAPIGTQSTSPMTATQPSKTMVPFTASGNSTPMMPTTLPPNYAGVIGSTVASMFNEGGLVEAEKTMASKFLGFKGGDLEKFLEANPAAAAKMGKYRTALRNKMTQKGTVFAQEGTTVIPAVSSAAADLSNVTTLNAGAAEGADPYQEQLAAMQRGAIQQTMQPTQAAVDMLQPQAADFIASTAGQTTAVAPMAEAAQVGTVTQAQMPMTTAAGQMAPTTVTPQVQAETQAMQPVTGTVSEQAQVEAAQQVGTSLSGIDAAQGNAILMDNPVQRQIEDGELISGVADAEKAAAFTEQVQAATATPSNKATVAGQLETLMADFEGGETPAWAAGSMRTAMQTLAARGLGASSLAGQAVVQAAMEAALPIAQMDAQTTAQFEAQNLSNRQQRAMLAAQQRATFLGQEFDQAFQARVQNSARIGDIANMNFTAEQNIALENSRAANSMNMANLTNRQAMVMAEAAALANLDMANLNNRQQAAVQNAQNFLQMDMANLSNEQQTAMFKAQQNIQAMFTDQAAENAAAQFNATSENQTNQFFANLSAQTSQFNAAQQNAMDQFNVNSINALREFNSELQQQRDLFNAQNGLVVAQSNAQWRQNIATLNTAALNESNAEFARTINGLTELNMSQIWQRERDIMSFAFQTANNNADRATSIAVQNMISNAAKDTAAATKSAGFAKAAGTIIGAIVTG